MATQTIKSWVTQDKTQTVIEVTPINGPQFHINLTASALGEFIQNLGKHRFGMIDPPADGSASAASPAAVANPQWEVTTPNPGEGKLLAVRHPGFGSLGFLFSDAEAEKIAQALKPPPPQITQPPKPTTGRNRVPKKSRSSARK